MAYEIVSTSSPSNLDGKSGFGTVIKTQNLPMTIDIAVSGLNGYTHLFGAGNPQNPVCWSYLQIRSDNKTFYVLSRISDTGADHTLRSNRLASHLILQAKELSLCTAGPAAIMLGGELIDSYNGIARETPERTIRPYQTQPARPCLQWQQLTGDAGWGGVLAETVLSNKIAYVIYNPGTDILPLFAESLSVIPASFRWKVTFSTFYSSQIERYNCMWRGIVAGTNAVPQGDCVVIDLTKPLPDITTNSNLVTLARTGSGSTSSFQPVSPASAYSSPAPGPASIGLSSPQANNNYTPAPPSAVRSSAPLPDPVSAPPFKGSTAYKPVEKPRSSNKGLWFVVSVMFLALIASGAGLFYAIDSINKLKQANQNNLTQTTTDIESSGDSLDSYNNLQKQINAINEQIAALTTTINETCTKFVTKINTDRNIDYRKLKIVDKDNNPKWQVQWEHPVDDVSSGSITTDNRTIATLIYNPKNKTFTLKLNSVDDFNFVLNSVFVIEIDKDSKYQFNFLNNINDPKVLADILHTLRDLDDRVKKLTPKEGDKHTDQTPQAADVTQLQKDLEELNKKYATLEQQYKDLNAKYANLQQSGGGQNSLTSVIHLDTDFSITNSTSNQACAFIYKNKQTKVDINEWKLVRTGEHKKLIIIDNVIIGDLVFNQNRGTFTMNLNPNNPAEARNILEQAPFKLPNSCPIYFF